jgi:hypothetical protein
MSLNFHLLRNGRLKSQGVLAAKKEVVGPLGFCTHWPTRFRLVDPGVRQPAMEIRFSFL